MGHRGQVLTFFCLCPSFGWQTVSWRILDLVIFLFNLMNLSALVVSMKVEFCVHFILVWHFFHSFLPCGNCLYSPGMKAVIWKYYNLDAEI